MQASISQLKRIILTKEINKISYYDSQNATKDMHITYKSKVSTIQFEFSFAVKNPNILLNWIDCIIIDEKWKWKRIEEY